jgi:molybdenum cofactor cytidylyltransferase
MNEQTGVIVLAAGNSVRLGRPKQTLIFKNQTLLQRIVTTATAVNCGAVVVVLGAHTKFFNTSYKNVHTVINTGWQQGMGSSICCGLKKIMEVLPTAKAAIITVCDQPFITSSLLQEILNKHQQTLLPIVASSYSDTVGTPVLFHNSFFSDLFQLSGNKGAKEIIKKNRECTALVDFPLGLIDIDTEEDYTLLLKKEKK